MKNQDLLQKYHALRSALTKERDAIQKRLKELNAVFGGESTATVAPPPVRKLGRPPGRPARVKNQMSLREAVLKVLSATPISRDELLAAVQKAGYRFASTNPLNSLQTFLYGSGKKLVKNVNGKFAATTASAATTKPPAPAKPAKAKRRISPEGRKRMAEAARKRWADKKKPEGK
jgi:hypothetical protein